MRILLVQPGGDYREAYQRLVETGAETYYGHRYVLSILEGLLVHGEVALMCCTTRERYVEKLPNGVTVMGAAAHPRWGAKAIIAQMAEWQPTHVVVLGPLNPLIRWAVGDRRRVMCQLADSFDVDPLNRLRKYGRIAKMLNHPGVEWISNHGVNACRSLVRIGVARDKILPWDFPHVRHPDAVSVRTLDLTAPGDLLYVGTIQPSKGVGDAIEAVAQLKRRGRPVRLRIVGAGKVARFQALAEKRGVADLIDFVGLVTNAQVFNMMREASAIIVPSRHGYPEGLPLTIYEGLCARTPIIASDHPMFAGHLVNGETALIYKARRPAELADRIAELLDDPALYAALSLNGRTAWLRMQNPVKWGDIISHWVRDGVADRQWLYDHRLDGVAAEGSVKIRS